MVRRDGKSKSSFKRIVSQWMAIVIAAATVLTVLPSHSYALDIADPIASATAEVSNGNTTVTVAFNTYASPASTLADLKENIQIGRSGSESFVDLLSDNANNEISMTSDGALVITLSTALTGTTNAINVEAGSIMNEDSVSSDADVTVSNITAHDITPPAFTGSNSSNGNDVTLNFDENISINAPIDSDDDQINAFLASSISVSTDGGAFVPFTEHEGKANQNGSNQIYIYYENNMSILSGTNTVIKIAGGTLKDAEGNLNEEMNLHVSPSVIQSTEISSDNHDVTITFNKAVFDNTSDHLKNYIYLLKDADSGWNGLAENDTVSIDSDQLMIHFAAALTGESNQIKISGSALKDGNGNVQNDQRVTSLIQANEGVEDPAAADTTRPKFVNYVFSNSLHDLALIFDEDVTIAPEDMAYFKQNLRYYSIYGWLYGLPADATVTTSGRTVNIHFETLPPGIYNYFYFYGMNVISDTAGNKFEGQVYTSWIDNVNDMHIGLDEGYFSRDGRFLSLEFDGNYSNELVDLTIDADGSHLKDQITISTDNGLTYSALDADDVVTIKGTTIYIIFKDRKTDGSIKVKMTANTVVDSHGYASNIEIDEEVAYNTPDFSGYLLSDTASQFAFEDNANWRNHVQSVLVYDYYIGVYRELSSSEYTLTEGKLTINKGVFQEDHYYYIRINAEGYSTKDFSGASYKSSEIFYMTAPVVTTENGITAKINLLNNAYDEDTIGNQSVVFELFDGSTPVSIVAANLKVGTGTYSANFNVSDAATNSDYTVKVYVVSKYSNDPTDVGLNLATVKTQSEFDLASIEAEENNNEG